MQLSDGSRVRDPSKTTSWELFDEQASAFEQRAGLPDQFCRDIASAVVAIGQVREKELIVEIGPGTGQIAQWFPQSSTYIGFDLSGGMLKESQRRLDKSRSLVQADANANWPLASESARVMFSSRALHLLDHEHVADQVFRISFAEGAHLILGRVKRDRESVRSRMAREMLQRLRQHGFEGRRGEKETEKLIDSCSSRGAEDLGVFQVARWSVATSPRQSVESWRCLTGLGGIKLDSATRDEILNELEAWAAEEFGGLDQEIKSEESYVLRSLRIPATK